MNLKHLSSVAIMSFSLLTPLVQAAEKPNVVFILADDLGSGDLSCYNKDSKIPTPRLDSLAAEGMLFTDAHSNSAVCTPTRYGVLTGRYCWRSRLKCGVLNGYSTALIEEGRETVASLLKKQGYNTACIGKWHLGMNIAKSAPQGSQGKNGWDYNAPIHSGPNAVGFDYFLGISASLDMPPYTLIENDRFVSEPSEEIPASKYPKYWRGGDISKDFSHEDYLPLVGKQACKFISQQSIEKPFFLYLPLPAPHKPVVPNKKFLGKTKAAEYGDYVYEMDWVIGQVIDSLKKKKLFNNTLLIVTSDNASFATDVKYGVLETGHSPNHIYRGKKTDIFEGGHRVPWIATWPGKVQAGSTSNQVVCTTDLIATCAEISGGALAEKAGEDSYSIVPILTGKQGKTPLREATIHHSISGMFSIRKGKWKLINGHGSGGRTKVDKSIKTKIQLYDMEKDIRETTNVYQDHPEVVKALTALLEQYKSEGRSTPK